MNNNHNGSLEGVPWVPVIETGTLKVYRSTIHGKQVSFMAFVKDAWIAAVSDPRGTFCHRWETNSEVSATGFLNRFMWGRYGNPEGSVE